MSALPPNRPTLSLVIPAYREERAIREGRLDRVTRWASGMTPPAEVLVVDDGSPDATAELARNCGARVLQTGHGGKAAAIREGIAAARGELVVCLDMDQAVPVEEAAELASVLEAGADVALGTRGLRRRGAPPARILMSLGHAALRRILLGLPWCDTQCGFKGFRREAAMAIFARLRVFGPARTGAISGPRVDSGFDVECLLVARRLGLTIREVPVSWRYGNTSHVVRIRDSWRGLKELLAISAARRKGYYPDEASGADPAP